MANDQSLRDHTGGPWGRATARPDAGRQRRRRHRCRSASSSITSS